MKRRRGSKATRSPKSKGVKGTRSKGVKGTRSKGVKGARTMQEAQRDAEEMQEWLGMSYRELAKQTGLTVGYVSRVMNGKRKPSVKVMNMISAVTGLRVIDIIEKLGMDGKVGTEDRIEITPVAYMINGYRYARLTHVLSVIPRPGLDRWRRQVGEEEATRIMVEAGEFGTAVHKVCEWEDKGEIWKAKEILEENEDVKKCLEAWCRWRDKYVIKIVEVERVLWSDVLEVAGTMDRGVVMKGDRKDVTVVDIKTGMLHEAVPVQLFGYRYMRNERGGPVGKAKRCLAVQLPRRDPGKLYVKEYYEKDGWEEKFVRTVRDYQETVFYDNI